MFDMDQIKSAASSRWPDILSAVGRLSPSFLDGKQGPCPKCGGKDRWRFFTDGSGGGICNQCQRHGGDGFAILQWFTGKGFNELLQQVAGYLGIKDKDSTDPAKHLEFLEWDDLAASYWCLKKSPINVESLKLVGARIARYRHQWMVIALPIFGQAGQISGWCIYESNGGQLPKWIKQPDGKSKLEWCKVKLTHGSQPGLIGTVEKIKTATTVWKLEGSPDVLAMLSLANLPVDVAIVTNAMGAKERPLDWILQLFAEKKVYVCHDADKPGQEGAEGWKDEQDRFRPGWATMIATTAVECRCVRLPYPIVPDHGRDVRDWINSGRTYEHFLELVGNAEIIDPKSLDRSPKVVEEDDDPHRLARINLERYGKFQNGATLKFWREEWYTWKPERGCYRKIGERELKARLTASVKEEFDRLNLAKQKNRTEEKVPRVSKVVGSLITNALNATASMTMISDTVEPMTWIHPDGRRERRNLIVMANGLIDLDKLMADAEESEFVLPHSPEWFSLTRLPYAFERSAKCPRWEAFLEKNLEQDPERIKVLQEWAGYCLLPDTSYQKFLVLEGEGANGKSVYCAGLSAILGMDNCSHIPLEVFGDRFSKTATIGKLVNICADVGEMDRAAEGYLKSFTSGDVMHFDRKGISGIDCFPTARMVMACNNLPRFSDRSSGIMRRIILIPWNIQISDRERIASMDKSWWWEKSGELPGMFLWAIQGLARLRAQGRFSDSEKIRESIEDYQQDINPARSFLLEFVELSVECSIKCKELYRIYKKWCEENSYRPLGERSFGKEVQRTFRKSSRSRGGTRNYRFWKYDGIEFSEDEICGEKTHEAQLF